MIEQMLTGEVLMSLFTLTFMEIVLGIDNIIFISIASGKLPKEEQDKATKVGLMMAMLMRVVLVFGLSYFIAMKDPIFSIDMFGIHAGFSLQAIILILGGLFLLYKSTSEIHHKLEGPTSEEESENLSGYKKTTLGQVIFQIALINMVFSFDSILTAVGMTNGIAGGNENVALLVMVLGIVISIIIMMLFAGPVGRFVNKHPTIQMLAMSFLILIGFMLIAEGAHLAHLIEGAVPKGYLYFAMFFSLGVEMLNMKLRKTRNPVELKQRMPKS